MAGSDIPIFNAKNVVGNSTLDQRPRRVSETNLMPNADTMGTSVVNNGEVQRNLFWVAKGGETAQYVYWQSPGSC